MEGSHSGLVRHLGKVVRGKPLQGFKSLTLRQKMKSKSDFRAEMGSRRRRDTKAFPPSNSESW